MAGQTDAQAHLPALCTSSDGCLSMYQVSLNSLLYIQRYAPKKLLIAKIKKGSNSVNTGDMVMVLAFCNSLHGPLSVIHSVIKRGNPIKRGKFSSLNYL